jgi:hypothetical protein
MTARDLRPFVLAVVLCGSACAPFSPADDSTVLLTRRFIW